MRVAINGTGIAGPTLTPTGFGGSGTNRVLLAGRPAPHRSCARVVTSSTSVWGLGVRIADRMGLGPALLDRCATR